jgi:hypothetical protein
VKDPIRKTVKGLLLIVGLLPTTVTVWFFTPAHIPKGTEGRTTGGGHVTIQNPDGVGNYQFGDTCYPREHLKVTVVASTRFRVLVQLEEQKGSSSCPSGTLFFMWKRAFIYQAARMREERAERERAQNKIRELIAPPSAERPPR